MAARMSHVARFVAMSVLAAFFVVFAINGASPATPWPVLAEALAVSFLFAVCIGLLASLVMSRYGRRLWTCARPPFNWLLMAAVLVALALIGSALTIALLIAVGYLPPTLAFSWLRGSARVSLIATLSIGFAISVYEMMRARLEAATLALRTKERDEAEARRLAAEARLAALEARVQPHFLFNTLNSIAALIPADPQGAEQMVGRLSTLLRATLDGTSSLVPVHEELAAVQNYLDIERVRFGERLRFALPAGRLPDDIRVPRLSIQTLVENSVKYAVSTQRHGATIRVLIERRPQSVLVQVEDDGPGFDHRVEPERHGLALLRERLAALYGQPAHLAADGTPGRCVISFEVPT